MQKVEKEMASLTEDEIEVFTESMWGSVDTMWPRSQFQDLKKSRDVLLLIAKAFGQPEGPALFILRTEVTKDNFTEDNFAKWAFARLVTLYWEWL